MAIIFWFHLILSLLCRMSKFNTRLYMSIRDCRIVEMKKRQEWTISAREDWRTVGMEKEPCAIQIVRGLDVAFSCLRETELLKLRNFDNWNVDSTSLALFLICLESIWARQKSVIVFGYALPCTEVKRTCIIEYLNYWCYFTQIINFFYFCMHITNIWYLPYFLQ